MNTEVAMSLIAIHRVGKQDCQNGLIKYLLVPDLPSEALHGPLHHAVLLANLWRFRRERSHVLASSQDCLSNIDDICYVRSLPRLLVKGYGTVFYVGQGDLSPFLLRSEDDFLLF